MPRKKQSFLNNNKKDEFCTTYSCQEEENKKEDQSHSSIKDSISISIDCEENNQESDKDSDSDKEKEELDDNELSENNNNGDKSILLNVDNRNKSYYKKKKNNELSFINKKRTHLNKKEKNKKKKISQKSGYKGPKEGKSCKKANITTFSEIDKCYKKLNDLLSEYSFSDIADTIIKINNDILDNNEEDNSALFKRIKNITSIIKNKESISMMCLNILFSKFSLNSIFNELPKKNEEKKLISENENYIDKEDEEEDEEINELYKSRYNNNDQSEEEEEEGEEYKKKYGKVIKGFNGMKQIKYIFGNHYYKDNNSNNIYCYYSKSIYPRRYTSAYCYHRDFGCKAKCVIFANSNKVQLYGTHNDNCRLSKKLFYIDFPDLKNKKWSHVQLIKKKYKYNTLVVQS